MAEPVTEPVVPKVGEPVPEHKQEPVVPPNPAPPEPVVPTAPEPEQVPEQEVPKEVPKEVPDGDFFSTASETLKEAGFNPEEVAQRINDNEGKISSELYSEMYQKLGKTQADLLVSGFKTNYADIIAKQEVEKSKVYDVVGGEDMWQKIAAWTATEEAALEPEAAKVYNEMLAAGGVKAALAANALKEAYMASPGFTAAPNLVTGDSTPPAAGVEPISRSEYTNKKREAFNSNDGVAVASLEARARFTMEQHPNLWRTAKIRG